MALLDMPSKSEIVQYIQSRIGSYPRVNINTAVGIADQESGLRDLGSHYDVNGPSWGVFQLHTGPTGGVGNLPGATGGWQSQIDTALGQMNSKGYGDWSTYTNLGADKLNSIGAADISKYGTGGAATGGDIGNVPGGGAGLPGAAGQVLTPAGQDALGSAPGVTKDNPIGTLGQGAGTAQGVFVGTAGTVAVEDLAKQVKEGAKLQSDTSKADTKAITENVDKNTKQTLDTGTTWWEYLGVIAYDLVPRAIGGAVAVVLIGVALWMMAEQQSRTA